MSDCCVILLLLIHIQIEDEEGKSESEGGRWGRMSLELIQCVQQTDLSLAQHRLLSVCYCGRVSI